jgi:hypothetical protein
MVMVSLNQSSESTRPTIPLAESKSAPRVDHKDILRHRLVNEAVAIATMFWTVLGTDC